MIEAPPRSHTSAQAPETPYVGLVPYREEDADFFFGRDREKRIVAGNLQTSRLTIVYGTSGVGKTSLLEAGVVRDLHEEVLANAAAGLKRPPFAICSFRTWRDDPLPALVEATRAAAVEALGGEELPQWRPGDSLVETLHAWTERTRTLLVILDQFEDYFLYHPDDDGEGTFVAELPRIVNDPNLRVNVVLSIREDAWAKLDRFKGRIPRLFANYFRVEHLSGAAAREAIEGPVAEWNSRLPEGAAPYEVESRLVEAVVEATTVGRISLAAGADGAGRETAGADVVEAPFLQLVMERVWRATVAAGSHELTLERLEALGGAQRIVETHLQEALRSLTRGEQRVAADAFRFLVTSTKTKIAHSASDLAEWTRRPEPEVAAVLDKLCRGESGRILRAVHPPGEGEATRYELFHDVLAEPILEWRRGYEQWRARRRFAGIAAVLLTLVAVFAALGAWALVQRNEARGLSRAATSAALAAAADNQLGTNPDRALLLGLAAYTTSPTADARDAVLRALQTVRTLGAETLLHTGSAVGGIAVAPDGRTIATTARGGSVSLWDLRSRTRRLALPGSSPVGGIVFSPDGRTLAVGSEDADVRLWDLQTRPRLRRRLHARGPVRAVAFGPGGRTVVAIDDRANVLLWDARRGTLLARLRAPAGGLPTLALSADGRTLAAATVGSSRNPLNVPKGRVRVWDVPSRTVLGTIRIETLASALALAPDGDMLAVGGSFDPDPNRRLSNPEGQLQLWHARSLRPASRKLHLKSFVDALAFRDRGHVLLGGLDDGSISAWAVPTLAPVGRPRRAFSHPVTGIAVARSGRTAAAAASGYGTVEVWDPRGNGGFGLAIRPDYKYALFYALAFSPDGRTVVAGGSVTDGVQAVRVASGAPATSYPSTGGIQSLAFTAGGSKLAGGTDGGYVRLWDTARGRRDGRRLGNCECGVSIVVVDGDTLAAAGDNGTIRLWSVARRRPNGPTLSAPLDQPVAATFLDGGKTFATVGFDGSVRLWDIARGTLRRPPLHIIPGAAAFGPDGHTVAIGGNRGVIWLWDLRPPAHGVPLPDALPDAVTAVGFSPDGRTIAAASERGLVRLWDVPSRTAVGLTLRTGDLLNALAFSPDGTVLAAAGSALRIWNGILWRGDVAGLRREVCGLVGGGLSRGEWALAAPRLAFRETCPG